MDFGKAIEALKRGETVARSSWNGMSFLTLQEGSTVERLLWNCKKQNRKYLTKNNKYNIMKVSLVWGNKTTQG